MSFNQQLYNDLYFLRQRIKAKGRNADGRAPVVCSDEALSEMTYLRPKKLSDLDGIPGIGKNFINNYGQQFIDVVLKYEETRAEKSVNISGDAANILKELEKKLVNINRKNRLLYMPKLANKYAYDLFLSGEQCTENIIFQKNSVVLCDVEKEASDSANYKKIVQLIREVNKDLRDKGQNDLYIGYPFVVGRLYGENFDVRAPLALIPVEVERTTNKIQVRLDESRDAIYNTTLILAYFKFNNITEPLPTDAIEAISKSDFVDETLAFYQKHGINIQDTSRKMCRAVEYAPTEFTRYQPGQLFLEPCAIMGKFPTRSSSIQKDFDDILEKNEINALLNDLLINAEDVDFYSESYAGDQAIRVNDKSLEISEHDIVYINDLNSSQETVLSAINKLDELVVQGPPGTGKSQTITSLISEFVSNGKTVLMVSEKKTALDVVYSRLGELSRYALLIDDVGNKELFYKQLSNMVTFGQYNENDITDLSGVSSKIDASIDRLKKVADKLYTPGDFGIEPYKMYLVSKKPNFSSKKQMEKASKIRKNRSEQLSTLRYIKVDEIKNTFSETNATSKLETFAEITEAFPWIEHVIGNTSEYDIINLNQKLLNLKDNIAAWEQKNTIARMFTKGKLIREAKTIISEYFNRSSKNIVKLFVYSVDNVIEGIGRYIEYQELKPLYESLDNEEKIYLASLLAVKKALECDLDTANIELFNDLIYEQIAKFETENRALFSDVDQFDKIIQSLSESISHKQKLTKKKLEMILSEAMYNLIISKRHGEILRLIDGKRKWSVNKFIKKFDFEIFKSVKIWLLTPEVVSEIIPLEKGIFDLVVFDEASQMYVEKGVPSIMRAKKVVIAGDHKQLRPSNLGAGRVEMDADELPEDVELGAALEEESLLDLARFKYQDVLLNFHYRSKYEELIAFSNYAFYRGRLYVSPNTETPETPPIQVHKMKDALWSNRSNISEAKYIVQLLKEFFKQRKDNETIGIITFNSSQRDLIDDLIDEESAKDQEFATYIRTELSRKKDGEDIGLFVKNIESVQGDERDVIIFSIGYAKNEDGRLVRQFGWLNQKGGENRLNVAISRAKKKVHIVTSFDPSELQVEDTKNEGPKILKKYLQYAFAVSEGNSEAAKQILYSFGDDSNAGENISFDSEFEVQVYNALCEKGYDVDTQIGIGGYSIDLAIKKNGKYVIGIECDGRLYHSSKSARERDYHRQK